MLNAFKKGTNVGAYVTVVEVIIERKSKDQASCWLMLAVRSLHSCISTASHELCLNIETFFFSLTLISLMVNCSLWYSFYCNTRCFWYISSEHYFLYFFGAWFRITNKAAAPCSYLYIHTYKGEVMVFILTNVCLFCASPEKKLFLY